MLNNSQPGHDAAYAHELLHGLASIRSSLSHTLDALDRSPANVRKAAYIVRGAYYESEIQFHDTLNYLASYSPDLVSDVTRVELQAVTPGEVLRRVIECYKVKAADRGIEFDWKSSDQSAIPNVKINVSLVYRIFHNVLSNALKYSYGPGGDGRYITIREATASTKPFVWKVLVENYGLGFSHDEVSRLFENGTRGKQAVAENIPGAGLGLGQIRDCIDALGGSFRFSCRPANNAGIYITTARLLFDYGKITARHSMDRQ